MGEQTPLAHPERALYTSYLCLDRVRVFSAALNESHSTIADLVIKTSNLLSARDVGVSISRAGGDHQKARGLEFPTPPTTFEKTEEYMLIETCSGEVS